jgi:hypothetical protein
MNEFNCGHTPDGDPVVLWHEQWADGAEWFSIEIGCCSHRLDHIDPALARALRASLTPAPTEWRAA